jgi:Rrf2 family protein
MQLTMTGEYAVRAMLGLSTLPFGTVIQIPEVSTRWDIPENFLRKIITLLAKAGLIHSQRGNGGGIRLATPAENLTLLDVVEAIEGKIYLNKCLISPQFCSRSVWCAVHIVWCEAQTALKDILAKRTLAELASLHTARQSQLEGKAFTVPSLIEKKLQTA